MPARRRARWRPLASAIEDSAPGPARARRRSARRRPRPRDLAGCPPTRASWELFRRMWASHGRPSRRGTGRSRAWPKRRKHLVGVEDVSSLSAVRRHVVAWGQAVVDGDLERTAASANAATETARSRDRSTRHAQRVGGHARRDWSMGRGSAPRWNRSTAFSAASPSLRQYCEPAPAIVQARGALAADRLGAAEEAAQSALRTASERRTAARPDRRARGRRRSATRPTILPKLPGWWPPPNTGTAAAQLPRSTDIPHFSSLHRPASPANEAAGWEKGHPSASIRQQRWRNGAAGLHGRPSFGFAQSLAPNRTARRPARETGPHQRRNRRCTSRDGADDQDAPHTHLQQTRRPEPEPSWRPWPPRSPRTDPRPPHAVPRWIPTTFGRRSPAAPGAR